VILEFNTLLHELSADSVLNILQGFKMTTLPQLTNQRW